MRQPLACWTISRDSTCSLAASLNKRRAAQQRLESGQGLAHEKRLFLPVPAHELRRAQAGKER